MNKYIKTYDMREQKEFPKTEDSTGNVLNAVITIAMPVRYRLPHEVFSGRISSDLFLGYMGLRKPPHYMTVVEHMPIDVARNSLVQTHLVDHPDATHILWWDHDIIPERDALIKLFRWNKPIVSGLYFQKYPPHRPHVYIMSENKQYFIPFVTWRENQLIEVEGTGCGFLLVRRDVFQSFGPPWFSMQEGFGEDFDFCIRARKAGFKVYLDTSVRLIHVCEKYPVDINTYQLYLEKEKEKMISF